MYSIAQTISCGKNTVAPGGFFTMPNSTPDKVHRSSMNPVFPSELLTTINSLLNRWATDDPNALLAATARGALPEGQRTGHGSASTVPYVLEAINGRP